MSGSVMYLPWITREDVRAHRDRIYVFGDNARRRGFGGQAKAMRGEPNALGIATKHKPSREPDAYFSADDPLALGILTGDLLAVAKALHQGLTVCVPSGGIGVHRAELPQRAPALAQLITAFFRACPGEPCPW